MLSLFDPLRDISTLSVTVRLVLAVICGGLVGIERERKRRPAGFRTHILICLGAAMTTLISQYIVLTLHMYTDMARLGAQVIAGVGFIGAGTIIVTRHRRVKGLTTAAGLWTSAIIGLACGAGYFEGALCATLFILIAELFFSRLEFRLMNNSRELDLFVEYRDTESLNDVLKYFHDFDVKIIDMEINRMGVDESSSACANFILQTHRKINSEELILDLRKIGGVTVVENFNIREEHGHGS